MLLIDGYNLLFAIQKPDSKNLHRQREALIAELQRYADRTNQTVKIIFDHGGPRRDRRPRVEVVYVAEGTSADDRIVAALEDTVDRTKYRVVSSDREIRRAAESRKVESVESKVFWGDVRQVLDAGATGEPGQKQQGITPLEADYWLKEFGYGGEPDETRGHH